VAGEGIFVRVVGAVTPTRMPVVVPVRVEGALTFAPGTVRIAGSSSGIVPVSGRLDGRGQSRLRIDVRGRAVGVAVPKLRLRVRLPSLAAELTPPRGDAWVDAYRRGALRGSGRELLERLMRLELTYARQRQYDMYLAAPDANGPSSATFAYRTAAERTAAPPAASNGDGDRDLLWLALVGIALLIAVPAAAVAWAHS
ncbi:MAG TPA: hypothetical protein VFL41_11675, partial [Gaiellaceae bacterium]|nr:hypothetical protein [Gaiellaceae bacterium]